MVHKRKFGKLSNFFLADEEGGQYSANPSDYFMMTDTDKFKGLYLGATEHKKGGWMRKVIVKKNPTKKDLQKEEW
jgi:hypothetical protein